MTLRQALGIGPGTVAAFVGGGGKTSLILRLVEECAAVGLRTVFTTTTRIFPPSLMAFRLDDATDLDKAAAWLQSGRPCCIYGDRDAQGKLTGIDPSRAAELLRIADTVLVEADGSRGLPLKAPADHEPVLPSGINVLVPVAGLTALGRPLHEVFVQRSERVASILGVPMGTPLSPTMVARLLLDRQGGLKGCPSAVRVVPTLGQTDALENIAEAQAVASELTALGANRVVLAAPRAARPVLGRAGDVAGLVLAAGSARRWGVGHKLLHSLDGKSLLIHSLKAPLGARLREVVVVTGAEQEAITELLRKYPVRIVHNENHLHGQATSMHLGLRTLFPDIPPSGYTAPAAVLIFLADQPYLTAEAANRLIARWHETRASVVAPRWDGHRRNPVLFAASLVPELLTVSGDEGGRQVVRAHEEATELVSFDDGRLFHDIDTVGDA